jgi:signal peptidase I
MTDEHMTDESVSESSSTRANKRNGKNGFLLFLRDIVIIFVVALLVSFLIKTFLIRSFFIPSASMEDTLQIDDRIIVNELVPSLIPVEHGDVVVFRDPGGWLPPLRSAPQNPVSAGVEWVLSLVGLAAPDSNEHLVKRVIGLPGDHVTCCNARWCNSCLG